MIDPFAIFQELVIPAGAQPGSPRIVMGPNIPPEMVTWANANSVVFYAHTRYEADATHYTFEAMGLFAGQIAKFEGSYDPTNTVYITSRTLLTAPPGGNPSVTTRIGSSALNTFQYEYDFQQTSVFFNPDASLALGFTSPFTIDGVSQGRGLVGYADSTGSSGAIGAETVVLSIASVTWVSGRAYEVINHTNTTGSVANNWALYQARRGTTTAGTILDQRGYPMAPTAGFTVDSSGRFKVRNNSGADITAGICITLTGNLVAGTCTDVGATTQVRSLEVRDLGASADYPNAIQI